ncbi:MAG: hypothetical protein FJX20_21165 [Alphaproteobacteria bacterium]|nr:hypothetical protein [Alphaproteobacteria bacterium]
MIPGWPAPLQRQLQVLVTQFLAGGEAWIGIASIDNIVGGGSGPRTIRLGGRLETLGSRAVSKAFVWIQGNEPELWLDPRDKNYRDLFDEFARTRLGMAGRPTGSDWNVDHVFPKAAGALDGLSHVRAMSIGAPGNQALGRTVEKEMKQRADDVAGRKRVRHATWMTIGKASGFVGWDSLPDSDSAAANATAARALFAYLAGMGITAPAGTLEERLTAHTLTRIR